MQALQVHALAAAYAGCALTELPTPEPGPGEALIRVRAAALNFPDLLMTRGEYQLKPELPFVLGMEAAGEVVSAPDGADFATGRKEIASGHKSVSGVAAGGALFSRRR